MIIKMTPAHMKDFNKTNEGFMVIGRMIPKYENDEWTYTEELYSEPYFKQYENDEIDLSYATDKDKAVFMYYDEAECVGQIRIRAHWNGFAHIEDLSVAATRRGQGIGTALIEQAGDWAKQNGFIGLVLETQDVNVIACRFYARNRFIIGAVDHMLYANFPTANEKAIFWYYKF